MQNTISPWSDRSETAEQIVERAVAFAAGLQSMWSAATTSGERYEVSNLAQQSFNPGGFQHQARDISRAAHYIEARSVIIAARGWHADWVWENASLIEKRSINQTEQEYRISRR